MLKRKLLIPTILLLASSGAAAPKLSGGSWSLGSWSGSSGMVSPAATVNYEVESKNDISVDSSASGIQVKDISSKPADISISKESSPIFDDLLLGSLDDGKSVEMTEGLLSEITKESSTFDVDGGIRRNFEELLKDLGNYESLFKTGQQIVEKYDMQQKGEKVITPRTRSKNKGKTNTLSLTTQQRQAIQKFYEAFASLAQDREDSLVTLKEINGESVVNEEKDTISKKYDSISKLLKRIKWNSNKVNLKNPRRKGALSHNQYFWNSWNANPFKALFKNEQEWKENIKLIASAEKTLKTYIDSGGSCYGNTLRLRNGGCYYSKEEYKKRLQERKENLNLLIALYLLKEMKALPSSS